MSNFQNKSLGEKKQVAKDYILHITFCVRKTVLQNETQER